MFGDKDHYLTDAGNLSSLPQPSQQKSSVHSGKKSDIFVKKE